MFKMGVLADVDLSEQEKNDVKHALEAA